MPRIPFVRALASLVVVALPLFIGGLIARRAVDVPYWDEWEWADLIYKAHLGTLRFADVWAQHSEHRMLVPNVLMLSLARFGGWDPVREQFLGLGILVLSQLAIVAMIQRTGRPGFRTVAAVGASLFLYGVWQWENLGWGFQTAWFICNLGAILVALLLGRPGRRPVHVALAMVVAVLASFSSSQGLLVWVVGSAAILLTFRRRAFTLVVWAIAAIVTYRIYRHGMYAVDAGHVNLLANPLLGVTYVLAYLGSPVAREFGGSGSALAGLVVLTIIVASFVVDVRSTHRVRRLYRSAPWYALATFPLFCAVATASGRAGFGIDQALASRYTTISDLAWVSAVGLAATRGSEFVRLYRSSAARYSLVAAATVLGCAILASTALGWHEWRVNAARLALARSELIASNRAALPMIYPDDARVIMLIGEMRTVHDGLFSGP